MSETKKEKNKSLWKREKDVHTFLAWSFNEGSSSPCMLETKKEKNKSSIHHSWFTIIQHIKVGSKY